MRLVAGLRPNPLWEFTGSLQRSLRPSSSFKGGGRVWSGKGEGREGEGEERGRGKKDPLNVRSALTPMGRRHKKTRQVV